MSFLVVNLVLLIPCRAADVVSVTTPDNPQSANDQLDLASQLYGLEVQTIQAKNAGDARTVIEALAKPETLAAVISARALPYLDERQVFSALHRPGGKSVPLLIAGLDSDTDPKLLRNWSGGAVTGCIPPAHASMNWNLTAGNQKEIVRQLAGIEMAFRGEVSCGFARAGDSSAPPLLEASDHGERLPLLINSVVGGQDVFLLAGNAPSPERSPSPTATFIGDFASIAPEAIYLRFAAPDRIWHSAGHYANLTVDDAWLTEPFGNLNYGNLLKEMEKHNFHTTIAFIPWNYDRSRPGPVALFREHPDRYSVCIHGNNHDHREFGDYNAEPLAGQTEHIKEALARMERFTQLTHIPYDRVMVFPHAIAPEATFAALKKYNYWATTNSENVPFGSHPPASPLFPFRPQTLAFADFLSIFRYSAEVPVSTTAVAINTYLGNPVLFYSHEGYFHPSIGVFDPIADEVNRLEPHTQWASLGTIAQHLYLVRSRADKNYDVRAFSPDFVLTNTENRPVVFHVQKAENFIPGIASLTIDGKTLPYENLKTEISFDVPAEPGDSRHIQILYANDLQISKIPLTKGGIEVHVLRWVSDFRDLRLSRSQLGYDVMDFYYRNHLDDVEREAEPWVLRVLLFLVALAVLWRFRRAARKTQPE